MAMYYYACRLSAACAGGGRESSPPPPPLVRRHTVSTISHQPGPSAHHHQQSSHRHHRHIVKATVTGQASPDPSNKTNPKDCNPGCTETRSSESVVYREGNLVSGRLEALIQHMVPTLDYYPDRAFLFAFLLTSRLFIKPHELLGEICTHVGPNDKEKGPPAPLVRLLSEWSETFPYDFRDERVMSHVRTVAETCVELEPPFRSAVSSLLQSLLDKLTRLERYEAYIHSIRAGSTPTLGSLSQTDVSELCGSPVSLAQQLTHIELERLSYIGPEEFVQAFVDTSQPSDEPRITHNYQVYADWFFRLSYLVLTDVTRHLKSKKARVRVVEFWVETARECFNIGNLNSLMAIIAGLNMSPISRLKRTWSQVDRTELSSLEREVSPLDDYCSYRSCLRAAGARFNKDDPPNCIVIPLFSLFASDLHQLCQECLILLPNGHINFEKFWQLAKQVTELITWKQVHCPFPKSPKVITYLQATPVLNEDAAMLASFESELPESPEEKELHSKLMTDAHKIEK